MHPNYTEIVLHGIIKTKRYKQGSAHSRCATIALLFYINGHFETQIPEIVNTWHVNLQWLIASSLYFLIKSDGIKLSVSVTCTITCAHTDADFSLVFTCSP